MPISPLQLTEAQQQEYLRKRVERFKEKYETLVAETGLRHYAALHTLAGAVPIPMLILPVSEEKRAELLTAIAGEETSAKTK